MKYLEKLTTIFFSAALAFLLVASSRGLVKDTVRPLPEVEVRVLTLYDVCVEGTIVPADLLRAIAIVESGERDDKPGDGGISISRFQLYETPEIHAERAQKWGAYDANDPGQAGIIAAKFLQDCIIAYSGDIERGICSYRQGVYGVERDEPTLWYYERVMNARARI
jgi:hypothetical protein